MFDYSKAVDCTRVIFHDSERMVRLHSSTLLDRKIRLTSADIEKRDRFTSKGNR